MDAGIIVAIVTGAFGLTTLIVQKLFDISCTKNENEDGSVKSFHCIPRCKNLIYPIPKEDIESAEKFAEKREIEAYHQDQEALAV